MLNKNRIIPTVLLLMAVFLVPAFALTARKLSWKDLIPSGVTFDDPLEALDREKLEYLAPATESDCPRAA